MTYATQESLAVMRDSFREYYFRVSDSLVPPARIAEREFGYRRFGDSGMIRHLLFETPGELKATLVKEAPADVYCSNAYYRYPKAPMQEKGWLGATLIFDIDAKDLELPCAAGHSFLLCQTCERVGTNSDFIQMTCRYCHGTKLASISLPCVECVEASKRQITLLFNYLKTDIGIPQDSFTTYFSGNNGFHVYIENVQFEALDSFARSDLAGYLMGIGIIPESFGLRKNPTGKHGIRFRKTNFSYGWRRRIADKINIDSPPKIEKLVEKMGGYSGFKTFLQETAMSLGVKLDPQVTSDVHRIFRLSGSLNSKSGLAKIQVTNLDSFDPFSDACLLSKDPITVSIKCPVVLSLKGKTFKLSKETATLPTYAAIYLMCKGIATAAS